VPADAVVSPGTVDEHLHVSILPGLLGTMKVQMKRTE
jgi:hypothetical protein